VASQGRERLPQTHLINENPWQKLVLGEAFVYLEPAKRGSARMREFTTGVGSKADIGTPALTQL
jgi:hypothetical protein